MDEVDCVVVGAGVPVWRWPRALALAGRGVLVLERAYTIGFETSSRNSEVIHGAPITRLAAKGAAASPAANASMPIAASMAFRTPGSAS